jgi:hypothetical protein
LPSNSPDELLSERTNRRNFVSCLTSPVGPAKSSQSKLPVGRSFYVENFVEYSPKRSRIGAFFLLVMFCQFLIEGVTLYFSTRKSAIPGHNSHYLGSSPAGLSYCGFPQMRVKAFLQSSGIR